MRAPTTLLKDSWDLFLSNYRLFIGIYLVPGILTFVSAVLFQSEDSSLVAVILALIVVVVSIFMSIAMIRAIANPTLTPKEAYKEAKPLFFPYLLVAILVGLVTMVGFIAFVIPGIIFAVWFTFSHFVLIFEGKRGTEAMKASKEYVRGRWWQVFGRYLFLMLMALIVSIVVGIVSKILSTGLENIGEAIVSFVANAIIMPVAVGYIYLMYRDISSNPLPDPETFSHQETSPASS